MVKDTSAMAQGPPSARRRKSSIVPGTKLSDFEVLAELGRGTYGVVSKVKSKLNGELYVLKKVRCASLPAHRQKQVLMEVSLLRRLDHPHVIGYYNSFMEKNSLYIVMEYASNGDLQRVLDQHKKNKSYIPEKTLFKMFYELAQAMQHLHHKNIIHRDIKMVNVLLDDASRVKLGDLGVSRTIEGEEDMAQSRVGTPLYLAPELIKRQPYDFKADIWALGVLMYNMTSLKGPFTGDNIYALGYSIIHDTPAPLPGMYSKSLSALILSMLDKTAERRPTVDAILEKLVRMSPQLAHGGSHRGLHDSEADNASMQTTAGAAGNDSLCAVHAPPTADESQASQHFPSFQGRVTTRQVVRPTSAHPRIEMRRLQVDKAAPGAEGGSQSDRKGPLSDRVESGVGVGPGGLAESDGRALLGARRSEGDEGSSFVQEAECSLTARTPRRIVVKQYTNAQHRAVASSAAAEERRHSVQEVERAPSGRCLLKAPDALDGAGPRGSMVARTSSRPVSAPQQRPAHSEWNGSGLDRDSLADYRRPSSKMLIAPRVQLSARREERADRGGSGDGRGVLEAVKEAASPLAAERQQDPVAPRAPPLQPARPTSASQRPPSAGSTRHVDRELEGAAARSAVQGGAQTIQVKQPVLSRAVMAQHYNALARAESRASEMREKASASSRQDSASGHRHSVSWAVDRPKSAARSTPDRPVLAVRPTSAVSGRQQLPPEGSSAKEALKAMHDASHRAPADAPAARAKTGSGEAPAMTGGGGGGAGKAWEGMGVAAAGRVRVESGGQARPVSAQARLDGPGSSDWTPPALVGGRQMSANALPLKVGGTRPATASLAGKRRPKISDLM